MKDSDHLRRTARHIFITTGIVVLLGATLLIAEVRHIEITLQPVAVPTYAEPTPSPPTGRRWFWERSQWTMPTAP